MSSSIQGPSSQSNTTIEQEKKHNRKQISQEEHKEIEDAVLDIIKSMESIIDYYRGEAKSTLTDSLEIIESARQRAVALGSTSLVNRIKVIEAEAKKILVEADEYIESIPCSEQLYIKTLNIAEMALKVSDASKQILTPVQTKPVKKAKKDDCTIL